MGNSKYIGVAAFGLRDSFSTIEDNVPEFTLDRSNDFQPSCVILSDDAYTLPTTGFSAKRDRTGLGFPFPPSYPLKTLDSFSGKRALISLIWEKLMEDIDIVHKWDGINCSQLMAEHIKALFPTRLGSDSHVAVAVPNFINMNAREHLLQDLKRILGLKDVRLVWRTVAAAMDWLRRPAHQDYYAQQFTEGSNKELGVLYLGLDCVEFSSFAVSPTLENNKTFYVPIRDFPDEERERFPFDGMSLFELFIDRLNKSLPNYKYNATEKSQILNLCDQIWPSLLKLPTEEKNYIFYLNKRWVKVENLHFNNLNNNIVEDNKVDINSLLIDLKNQKYNITNTDVSIYDKKAWLDAVVAFVMHNISNEKLASLIVTGPLSSEFIARELANGLFMNYLGDNYAHRGVWYTNKDDIADGTALFAQRVARGLPSYNDKLDELSIFAIEKGQNEPKPISLLKPSILKNGYPAGKIYSSEITDITFYLPENVSNFEVFIAKGKFNKGSTTNQLRAGYVPFNTISKTKVKLVTTVQMSAASGYAIIKFAAADISSKIDRRLKEGQCFDFNSMSNITLQEIMDRFRRGLSYPPDLKCEPFTIGSYDKDYVKFRKCWSAILTMKDFIKKYKTLLNEVEVCLYQPRRVKGLVLTRKILNKLPNSKFFNAYDKVKNIDNSEKYCFLLDQYGSINVEEYKNEYDTFINEYIAILEKFLDIIDRLDYDTKRYVVNQAIPRCAAYLRGNLTEKFKKIILDILEQDPKKTLIWNYAASVFSSDDALKRLFDLFYKTFCKNMILFKGTHALALGKMLDNYPSSKHIIDRKIALLMIKCGINLMKNEYKTKNFKKSFYNAAYLILEALKYRAQEPDFLYVKGDNISHEGILYYNECMNIMDEAVKYTDPMRCMESNLVSYHNNLVAVRDRLKEYFEGEGSIKGLEAIRELAGEDSDKKSKSDSELNGDDGE